MFAFTVKPILPNEIEVAAFLIIIFYPFLRTCKFELEVGKILTLGLNFPFLPHAFLCITIT